jgi:hypothetical protein
MNNMRRLTVLKNVFTAGLLAALVISAAPAAAQTSAADTGWLISAEGGVEAVQNVGGLGGVQVGRRLSSRLDVFGEAVYLQDVVTRRRNESADTLAAFLTQAQGKTADANVTIPAWSFVGGARFFLTGPRSVRPYIEGSAGASHVTLQPAFTLAGADVTTTLGQYGVTLGSDLTGTATKPTFAGGFGVSTMLGKFSLDTSVRVFSIQLDGQAANAIALAVGIGRKF